MPDRRRSKEEFADAIARRAADDEAEPEADDTGLDVLTDDHRLAANAAFELLTDAGFTVSGQYQIGGGPRGQTALTVTIGLDDAPTELEDDG